jgi:nucleotide-binding universal stress UspA family protein
MKRTIPLYDACRRFSFPRRIAVATDLDDREMILPYAISEARTTGAHLCLIHALDAHELQQGSGWRQRIGDRNREIEAMDRLEDMQRSAHMRGVCCSIRLCHGEPKQVILDALHQSNADRLIAGAQRRLHLRDVLHGSLAKELLSVAPIPTLFIGPNVRPCTGEQTRNLLCLVSLEGEYSELVRFALLMGEVHRAHVTLMHVLKEEAGNVAQKEERALVALQNTVNEFGRRAGQTSVMVNRGAVVETIAKTIEELRIDALILGDCASAHSSRIKELLTYQMMVTATCPVYSYRGDDVPIQPAETKLYAYTADHSQEARPCCSAPGVSRMPFI